MSRVHSPQAAHTHRADGPAVLDLIERLEKAEAGSLALDREIMTACGFVWNLDFGQGWWSRQGEAARFYENLSVTRSLDAALALAERVLPGWHWAVSRTGVILLDPEEVTETIVNVTSGAPALALCIAVLRATTPAEADSVGTEPKAECTQ